MVFSAYFSAEYRVLSVISSEALHVIILLIIYIDAKQ